MNLRLLGLLAVALGQPGCGGRSGLDGWSQQQGPGGTSTLSTPASVGGTRFYGSGGATSTGGMISVGAAFGTGGTHATGGSANTAGKPTATGGTSFTVTLPNTGGRSVATGGFAFGGGARATGGSVNTGGVSVGGGTHTGGTGGATHTGGTGGATHTGTGSAIDTGGIGFGGTSPTKSVGGATHTGGLAAVGGSSGATGNSSFFGGSVNTGGLPATGGVPATGGTSSEPADAGDAAAQIAVSAVSAGSGHTCAIFDGSALCWGAAGMLGDSTLTSSPSPVPVEGLSSGVTNIAAGYTHTCAVANGGVSCWGNNDTGQVGDVNTANAALVPFQVPGLAEGATAVAAGINHSCAILEGRAKCWGKNSGGELGSGATSDYSAAPVQVQDLTAGTTAITAGTWHTCVIVNGAMRCWGINGVGGRLGSNSTVVSSPVPVQVQGLTAGVTAIAAGSYHTCAVVNGGAFCWGDNHRGQLGDGTAVSTRPVPTQVQGLTAGVTGIAAGGNHTCAIVNGAAQCWGENDNCELGDGTAVSSHSPIQVQNLTAGVTAISLGEYHTCAIVNGRLTCWGANLWGQLGNGTTASVCGSN